MKWATILVLLVVVAIVAEARLTPEEKAARKAAKKAARQERKQNKGCKYHYKNATCDEASGKMVAPLDAEKSTDTNCEATKTLRRNCGGKKAMKRKDCKYTHIGATCDAATNVLTKTLAADQPADCPPTKTKTVKKCPDMEKLAKRGNKKDCGCKYHKRGTCDPETLIVTRHLKRCSPDTCEPTMTQTVTECPTERGRRNENRRGNRGKNRL